MNKQEAIEKIKKQSMQAYDDFAIMRDTAIYIVNQIDEPEKPVVPQYVADWYEEHIGTDFEYNLYRLYIDCYEQKLEGDLREWIRNGSKNKAIQTLVAMYQFGYEVEKEKLYTVELPNPNCPTDDHYILFRNKNRDIIINRYCIAQWKKFSDCQLTEAEIKKDFEWVWKFAEEVNNHDD